VLLVEDEVPLAEMVRRGLVADGHAVEVVHDGIRGFEAAATGDHDVVVLDIMLPGLSGYRILERLRAAQVWTPVLMLTAKDGEYDEADAFDLGADDYLVKPFSFVVLLARLRALMRRAGEARPAVLTRDDLLAAVWGGGGSASRNVVEVYVGYLRRKLEADGEARVIQTVRGVGYALREP